MHLKSWGVLFSVVALSLFITTACREEPARAPEAKPAPGKLVLYTALPKERAARLAFEFGEQTGIETELVLSSIPFRHGEIAAKIEKETAAPKGDVFFGGDPRDLDLLKAKGLLVPLDVAAIPNLAAFPAQFRELEGYWVAYDVEPVGFAVNKERLKELNLPEPKSWQDLTNPVYKGQILFPSAVEDRFGRLACHSLLQLLGEQRGWEYVKQLHANGARYMGHGEGVRLVATGLFPITVDVPHHILPLIRAGFPVKPVYPQEGTGYTIGAVSIIKDGPNLQSANRFVNFILSRKGSQFYTDVSFRGPIRSDIILHSGAVPLDRIKLLPMDFTSFAEKEKHIIEQWRAITGS